MIYEAFIPADAFNRTYHSQQESEWCWAASISNIFGFLGHPLSQATIVRAVFGSAVNRPAEAAIRIAQQLNRDWTDDNGRRFHARLTGAFDAFAGVRTIDNQTIINCLRQNQPVIICNTTHCMVLTALDYGPTGIIKGFVFDPFPLVPRIHELSPAELVPLPLGGALTFVGTVEITDAETDATPGDDRDPPPVRKSETPPEANANGVWRGTPVGLPLPIVFTIDTSGDSTVRSPAQGNSAAEADVDVDGNEVKITVSDWDLSFDGRLDGNRLRGTLEQHGRQFQLSLRRSSP